MGDEIQQKTYFGTDLVMFSYRIYQKRECTYGRNVLKTDLTTTEPCLAESKEQYKKIIKK